MSVHDTKNPSQGEEPAEAAPLTESSNNAPENPSEAVQKDGENKTGNEILTVVFSCPVDHSGTTVYVKGWKLAAAEQDNSSPVVLVHDLGENIGLYRKMARSLVRHGRNVYGFDLRGHGRSGRMLGHVTKFELLVNDLLQVIAWVRYKQGGKKVILVAQGIGALIAAYFINKHPGYCQACVLAAPCFKLRFNLSKPKKIFIKTMSEMSPKFRLPVAATPRFTSGVHGKATMIESLTHQPYPGITANFAQEILTAMQNVDRHFKEINIPSLIIFPEGDEVCDFDIVRDLVARHHNPKLFSLLSLPEVGHHVFAESEQSVEASLEAISQWLTSAEIMEPSL